MAARILELADAVVAAINAATLSQSVTATRSPFVDETLVSLTEIKVSVAPGKRSRELASRASDDQTLEIDVGVQQKLGTINNTTVDPLVLLQEEIEATIYRQRLTTDTASWLCIAVETLDGAEPGYATEHLRTPRCFTGVSRFRFRKLQA